MIWGRNGWFALAGFGACFAVVAGGAGGMTQEVGSPASPVAQATPTTSLVGHVHRGTCDALDPVPLGAPTGVALQPAGDAGTPRANVPMASAGATTLDVALDNLLAAPHAIDVHAGAAHEAGGMACGEIRGPEMEGTVVVPLQDRDGGLVGVATLGAGPDGATAVALVLPEGEAACPPRGGATPVAAASPGTVVDANAAIAGLDLDLNLVLDRLDLDLVVESSLVDVDLGLVVDGLDLRLETALDRLCLDVDVATSALSSAAVSATPVP